MKIWLDSLSNLNRIYNDHVSHVEKVLRSEYNDESNYPGLDDDDNYDDDDDSGGDDDGDCSRDYGYHNDDCSSDDDDDCCSIGSSYNARTPLPQDQEHASYLTEHHFQLANTLHIQACDASHWLVCNPCEAGNIAVIDEEALALLENFRMPTTLQEVIAAREASTTHLLPAILLFLHLRFLCDLDQAPVTGHEHSCASTLSAWLHITNACNLRCHYCYVSKSSEHMEQETSQRSVDAVIRSAVHHGYAGIHLKYAGGEAALQMPQVLTTHDYAQKCAQAHHLRLSASLLSNGTILTQRMIEQLKERRIHVMISLDGIGAAHDELRPFISGAKGSFALVDRTISRLLASGLRPSINVTVSGRNIADLPTLLSYILERDLHFTLSYYRENDCSAGMSDLQFSEEQMIDGMRAAFAFLEEHLPKRRIVDSLIDKGSMRAPHHYTCGMGRNYLVISERGEVSKCQADLTRTVTTIQADDPLHEIRSDRTGMQAIDVDHKEGCHTCTWRYWCRGGCPLVTYRMTGRNDVRSPNCAIYQALYPEAVRLEALRLLKYEVPVVLGN